MASFFRNRGRDSASDASNGAYEFAPPSPISTPSTFLTESEQRARSIEPEDVSNPGDAYTDTYDRPPSPAPPNLPRLTWGRTVPGLTLKLRKRVYPLGITRLTAGVDVDVKSGDVRFKWAWADRFLGARLSFDRSKVALTKRLDVPDMRASVDLRAQLDVRTRRTLLSFVVRPMPGVVGLSTRSNEVAIRQRLPIDKRVDVELFGRVQMPEARFSAGSHSPFSFGQGNFVVHLDHVNLKLMLQ